MPRTRIEPTIAPENEARVAEAASRAIEQHKASGKTSLRVQITEAGREVMTLDVPPSAVQLIRTMLKEMGSGKALTLVADEAEITTKQAADLLHVSRPYLVGMIEKGELPARMVGKQRRLPLKDVLAYKKDNEAKRRDALRELAALDQELGLR
jgi:excisionase family DNA binding protein